MDEFKHLLHALEVEALLALGVLWMWFGHLFTPEALSDFRDLIQTLTTIVVFALACYRAWRVLIGGGSNNIDFGGGR